MRTISRLGPVLALLVLGGCAPHVILQGPPPNAPPAERQNAYAQLRPAGVTQGVEINASRGYVSSARIVTRSLVLANGAEVFHADDLLPVVADGHPAALSAERYGRNRKISHWLIGTGIGAEVTGVTLALAGLIGVGREDGEGFNRPLLWTGLSVLLAGAIGVFIGRIFNRIAKRHRTAAFQLYDGGLRAFLGIGAPQAQPQPGYAPQPQYQPQPQPQPQYQPQPQPQYQPQPQPQPQQQNPQQQPYQQQQQVQPIQQ